MDRLKAWMQEKFDGKHVEPNSGLGQAIGYMLKHSEPLTLFLRQPGAPQDNNRCEQALKMAILHRKSSLSYKTLNGAQTGDLFMSLIPTCRLNRVSPFAYVLAITTHATDVTAAPRLSCPGTTRSTRKIRPPPNTIRPHRLRPHRRSSPRLRRLRFCRPDRAPRRFFRLTHACQSYTKDLGV
jgi:hypothetical protein